MTEEKGCCQESLCHAAPAHGEDRRLVVKILAGAVGAIAALIPAVIGAISFVDPATRREKKYADPKKPAGQKTENGFIRVASLADVPASGQPLRVAVRDDVTNKWTFTPNEPVGEVFLRKTKDASGAEQLTAFTTVCPHLGCAVSEANVGGKRVFKCPCHNSSFELDGTMIQPTPSPRGMDTLATDCIDGYVYVKYESFYAGRSEKKPKR